MENPTFESFYLSGGLPTHFARSESIRTHFISHVSYLEANVFDLIVDQSLIKDAKKLLRTSSKDAEQEGMKKLREYNRLFEHFGTLHSDGWKELDSAMLNAVSDELLKEMKRISAKDARDILEVVQANKSAIDLLDIKYPSYYFQLQWELWQRCEALLVTSYPIDCHTFLDWLTSDSQTLSFHIESTLEAERLKQFVKKNKAIIASAFGLKTHKQQETDDENEAAKSALVGTGKRWTESPFYIIKNVADKLFLTFRQVDKVKGKSEYTKLLAKEYGIRYAKRTTEAKREVEERFKEKKWLNLTEAEKDYAASVGAYCVLEKRDIVLREVFEVISKLQRSKEKNLYSGEGKAFFSRNETLYIENARKFVTTDTAL